MDTTSQTRGGSAEAQPWDAVVIGGGAAGLSAGIVLTRAQFATLVVDGGQPRNGPADHMHGYLTRDGMAPSEFVATGRDELSLSLIHICGSLTTGPCAPGRCWSRPG